MHTAILAKLPMIFSDGPVTNGLLVAGDLVVKFAASCKGLGVVRIGTHTPARHPATNRSSRRGGGLIEKIYQKLMHSPKRNPILGVCVR